MRYRHIRPDGSAVAMFWSMSWVKEDQACYCVGRDMTEQDELQERAAQAQRMEREHARDQFESLGYDVITAENAQDAIAMLNFKMKRST